MMAGYNRNTSSSEEEEETKPNLRDIFRKPAASNNQAPSTKKSSKTREYSEGERLDDEYGTRKKTSSTTRVTGKIRNKGEPEKKSADDFMAIFQQTTLGERPEKAGLKNNLSSQRSSSDDSEEDEENKTPKSSVSSGSRSYPSKDKTEPSPDDPFKRLQAGMKDNSEEDDKNQTVTRHTSKSSVSSGSRSNLSKDKTVPSPDDPFTTLQAEIKADDSEEDDENQTVSRHTPKSRVSSGSRKYQSKNKTVTSPDDPFTRLQAGMKADDSEKDDENQTVTRNTPTSSVSSGSRKYQSKDNTVPSPDDPFTRLQAGMKADDSEEDDEKQTFNRHTPKSSVSSRSRKYQSKDNTVPPPDDPFTRLQAGMKGNAQDQEKDELADDSEEDDENQTVSRHTPKSSVSSGSRKYQSKNKTVPSPDDPFTRLQAGMKDDSEKDDGNQTVSRHTPTSSVSSGSRKYQSKDNTVPSPDDPFTRLQAGMKGNAQDKEKDELEDDSEEDDEKQTFNRHTPKSSVSSGSRKYQSKDNTVPAPDDPFTRLQAGMKADDSEEDDENQTVSRHTPKSSVSSGSRKYQSKNKTVPSPDDPFTRLQAGMKDDSEKDDENQTVSRHTPTSSVSSGSRKYQSKDNTVPSPDDPFTRLQAGMKGNAQDKEKDELADDSEEDDEKQTFNRHTPKSSVSSGSRKYQSKNKTVPSPDDPFTRLQAGMKRNAQDKGSDKHGQKQSVYENEESFSDGSRGSLSDNADASTQDDHFKRLVESTKDTKAKQTRSARNIKDETESSSLDDSDDNVQPAEEYNPFMKMVADVNRPKSKPGNSKHSSRKPSDDSTPNGAARTPDFMSKRKFDDLPPSTSQSSQGEFSAPRPPPSTQRIYEEMTRMFNTGQGNFATSNPAFKTDRMFKDFAGMANGAEGNLATSNPAFQTDRMFEDFAGMANGAEGGAPNPPFTTESMFGNFSGMPNGAEGTGAAPDEDTSEATAKMFEEIQRLVATTQSDDPIRLLKEMIEPTLTEEEKKPITIESLMAKPRGTEGKIKCREEIPDDDTGIADAKPSVRLKEMEEDARLGRGHASGEFRPLYPRNRLGGLGDAAGGLEGIGGQNPMAQMQMLQQMLGGQGGQNPMAQMQMLQQMLGGQAGQDPMAQSNILQQMMGGQGGDIMNMLGQAGRGRGSAPLNQMAPFQGGQNPGSAGRGSAPSNQMAPFLGGQNPGSAGRGSSPANQVSPLLGAQSRGGAGGQNPMAQMQMLQEMLGGQGGQNPMAQMQMLQQMLGGQGEQNPMAQMLQQMLGGQGEQNPMAQMLQQMLGGQGGQNPMAQMQMLQQMLGGQAGQDPMAQLNMLQQMMGGQGGDIMNMLGQAGRGRGRGMGLGRGSGLNTGFDDEEINIENLSDNDIIRQMLEWEVMRAQSNPLKKDPNGTTTLLIVDTSGSMAGDAMIQTEQFLNTFMAGLEHQQKNLNMQENVAVITVGTSVEVKQHLTNNYPKIREALHCLCAEGPSKLHFGLMLPMSIVQQAENGGIKDFGGHAAAPRVILISDGRITGQTDGPNFPDEREKKALQNVTLESLNMMIQMTLTQVFCIPVGQSDNGFLEFISSTTGGKTMDRKSAQVLSRYHIYHTVVASLKQHQTEPTTDSIRHQLVTMAQTYDDDDVAEVFYLWRQPEPDIQGRNQRLAQQEEESSRRRQGGGQVGQGRGGGMPGMGGFGGHNPGMGGLLPGMGPRGRGLSGFPQVGRGRETGQGGSGTGHRDFRAGGQFEDSHLPIRG